MTGRASQVQRISRTIAAVLFLSCSTISIQNRAVAQGSDAVGALTDKHVDMFANVINDLKAWNDEMSARSDALSADLKAQGADPSATLNAYREMWGSVGDPREEVTAMIQRAGFSSVEEYRQVSERILAAYSALAIDENKDDTEAAMDDIMQGLAANANLSAEQKAQMQAVVDEAKANMQEYQDSVPQMDRKVVERRLPMLKELFGDTTN